MKSIIVFVLFNFALLNCINGEVVTINPPAKLTDDSFKIIQDALDKVAETGGMVYIKEGTYYTSSNFVVGSNTHVRGDGIDKTNLVLQPSAPSWWSISGKNAGFFRADMCKNIKISDITIDGNKDNQSTDIREAYGRYGIFMEACNNITYDKVKVQNFQGYGFDPHGYKPTMTWTTNMNITNCIAHNNDWDGFTIDQSENVIMKNNIATENGRHGFNIVSGSKNILIEDNYADKNGFTYLGKGNGCGIMVQNNFQYGTQDVIVNRNNVLNSEKAGICLNDVKNTSVSNNVIIDSEICLHATDTENSTITDNKCMTNAIYSISPVGSISISNNINGTIAIPSKPEIPVSEPYVQTSENTSTPSPETVMPNNPPLESSATHKMVSILSVIMVFILVIV
jgi:parallel beta-helix repeat protein